MKFLIFASCLFTIACGGCSAERALRALNTIADDEHFKKTTDLSYGTDRRQRMDLYQPVKADKSVSITTKPLVIFIHGGAWRTGSKDEYEFVAASLTKQGHSVLVPNYRLYPFVTFPEFITDIAQAVAQYEKIATPTGPPANGLSTIGNVVLMGHSSGAHKAALLATDPSYFQQAGVKSNIVGLIALSGPYNLPLDNEEVSVVFPDIESPESVNPVLQARQLSGERSSRFPPTLLLHGKDDERVTIKHTREFAAALRDKGVTVTVEILRGGHAGAVVALAGQLEFLNDSLAAVERYLQRISDKQAG